MKQKDYSFFVQVLSVFLLLVSVQSFGQGCSENIGFELGTFKNWECFAGKINSTGVISVNSTPPLANRHDVIKNTYPQLLDPFGKFPINCPNGSGFSAKLGNSSTQSEAEQLSYTFTVPANQNNYSIIYNYAVVLENPSHQDYQQPKFTSKVFDVTSGQYVQCGSFEFVASANLPGFKLSTVKANVYYKTWSPITVNLYGYAGKTIRLEFTTNDCTLGGHFGYAYLDVNENCSSPISGNVYCNGANGVSLTAPFGFKEYRWFNADYSQVLGTENILKISPPPPAGTNYQLEIVPFPGLGCLDTLSTTIQLSPDAFKLNVVDSLVGCITTGVDLTAPSVTQGSSTGLTYSYFIDANQTEYMPTPKVVTKSGIYYIKAVNATGCNDMKPVKVIITDPPNVVIKTPAPACAPNTVNLTLAITNQSDPGLTYTYWKDAAATIAVTNPTAVDSALIYTIKATAPGGCAKTVPVNVVIGTSPKVSINNVMDCGKVDITTPAVTTGSDAGLTYSYWQDTAATVALPSATAITTTGNYFVKATTSLGCYTVKSVKATVNPYPAFTTNPVTVTYPATADITSSIVLPTGASVLRYSYWKNSQTTVPVANPKKIDANGTYYIRASTQFGCTADEPVTVVILAPPDPKIVAPNVFSPNHDGVNDLFKVSIVGEVDVKHFKIYNRYGQLVFETIDISRLWDGTYKGQTLPVGTYYWVFEGVDRYKNVKMVSSGSITLLL